MSELASLKPVLLVPRSGSWLEAAEALEDGGSDRPVELLVGGSARPVELVVEGGSANPVDVLDGGSERPVELLVGGSARPVELVLEGGSASVLPDCAVESADRVAVGLSSASYEGDAAR
ncbi:MAG: hypothetical protein RLZZ613_1775 [Pseudomonadota bacterium]